MATRVNPKLIDELEAFGAEDVSKCYHCGNCSAMCPFSKESNIIPRRSMRYLQMGLERNLESSLEPWLCYYCGECSESCPRDAEPGETMMSLRRWLTSRYDFTGISRLFYRSGRFEIIAVVVAALLTGLGFVLWGMSERQYLQLRPAQRLPAGLRHPHLRLGPGRSSTGAPAHELHPHVVVHDGKGQERPHTLHVLH